MICVAATQDHLIIPDSLLQTEIQIVKPLSTLTDEQVDLMFQYEINLNMMFY